MEKRRPSRKILLTEDTPSRPSVVGARLRGHDEREGNFDQPTETYVTLIYITNFHDESDAWMP